MGRASRLKSVKSHGKSVLLHPLVTLADQLEHLRGFISRLVLLRPGPYTFNMDEPEERVRLIDLLWQPDCWQEAIHANSTVSNPELTSTLSAVTAHEYSDRHMRRDINGFNFKRAGLFEGIFCTITRIRSQKLMPFLTALLSVTCTMTQVSKLFAEVLRMFHRGVLADFQWATSLVDEAIKRDPGPSYEELPGVGAAMLDNLTIRVDHRGTFTTDAHGFTQNMTLWQSMAVPRSAAPPGFDVDSIGVGPTQRLLPTFSSPAAHAVAPALIACTFTDCKTMFKPELSMFDFTRLFSVHNPDVVANKQARFTDFLTKAKTKTMFDRPNYVSPWRASFRVFPAILDRLQSSYEDCRFEFNEILTEFRGNPIPRQPDPASKKVKFVFVGVDGLTVGRGNHEFANNVDEYLDIDKPPWIIWVHGEHPHLTWHVLHA